MKYNPLGTTGLEVSEICLGTMTWGKQNTEAEGHEQMDYAVAQGVNFFDTAELYAIPPEKETQGRTEEIIGSWFASRKNREKIILASKVTGPGIAYIRDGVPITSTEVDKALDLSLARLQTDYIDLYQLHWPNRAFPHFGRHYAGMVDFAQDNTSEIEENFLDILEGLNKAVQAGKICAAGLSNETAWGIMSYNRLAEAHDLPRMQSIQNEYSLVNQNDDPYISEVCIRDNVSYLAWSPLGGGMLSGKYLNGARPKGARWSLDDRPIFRDTPKSQKAVQAYVDIADKHGLDVCQMALAHVTDQEFVTSTIIGATTMDQLKTNIASKDLTLTDQVKQEIDAVYRTYPIPY